MAKRPIFAPKYEGDIFILESYVNFTWHAGMSLRQKQRSIDALHGEASAKFCLNSPLEVSSKSENPLGVALSSFNLTFVTKKYKRSLTVEAAFQGSKVFEMGGPYRDIFDMRPMDAKRDGRLKSSGSLVKFSFYGVDWPLVPRTAFYDWLYINALMKNQDLVDEVSLYDYFTDIEFNPEKSVNCQARSVALFLSLRKRDLLRDIISDPMAFRALHQRHMPEPQHQSYREVML